MKHEIHWSNDQCHKSNKTIHADYLRNRPNIVRRVLKNKNEGATFTLTYILYYNTFYWTDQVFWPEFDPRSELFLGRFPRATTPLRTVISEMTKRARPLGGKAGAKMANGAKT